jgi:peptidoglycan LD-endopeptidase LytH
MQGGRYAPVSNTFGMVREHGHRAHQGWDLDAQPATRVFAIADGELSTSQGRDYGTCLRLEFTYRGEVYYAFYAHLSAVVLSGPCSVAEGTVIALTGRSGNAARIPVAEAHLHFEIRTKPSPGKGLGGRIDPGEILGYNYYGCYQ